jgi:CRISPR-associated protein Cas2
MSMTLVTTRNVSPRVRGFLASVMLEVAAGIYAAPRLSPAVRERVWAVLQEWFATETDAAIVMVWAEASLPGGLGISALGTPPIGFCEADGLFLARRSTRSA